MPKIKKRKPHFSRKTTAAQLMQVARHLETKEERQRRLQQHREYLIKVRLNETVEEHQSRMQRQREYAAEVRRRKKAKHQKQLRQQEECVTEVRDEMAKLYKNIREDNSIMRVLLKYKITRVLPFICTELDGKKTKQKSKKTGLQSLSQSQGCRFLVGGVGDRLQKNSKAGV